MPDTPDNGAPSVHHFWARVAPALLLAVLSPLVAEFLLGDFSVRQLYLLIVLLPLYGGGALLIREVTRRTGRGWPTMLLLGTAYGLFEEGITTMSLFNPDYGGMHLLRYGFIPALGTSLAWTVFVVAIHVVFSISTPILIAEGVAGRRRTQPWLKAPGLAVAALLLALGAAVNTAFQIATSHFVAPAAHLVAVTVLVVALVVAAFVAFPRLKPQSTEPGSWRPWVAFPAVLILLSAFELARYLLPGRGVPAPLVVVLMLGTLAGVGAVVRTGSRRSGWSSVGCLAVAAGAVGTYGWLSLLTFARGHTNLGSSTGPVDVAGQIVLILVIFGLIALGLARSRTRRLGTVEAGSVAREARQARAG